MNNGVTNLRSVILNKSQQIKIPPTNKNINPNKQRINVVDQKCNKQPTFPRVEH